MASLKKFNGSTWVDSKLRKYDTDTDTLTTLPVNIYADDTTATVGLKGQMVQSGTPSPQNPVMPQGTGERTGNLYPLDASKLHVGRIENDGTIDYEIGTITVGTDRITYEANATWRGFYTDFIQVNENEKLTFSPINSSDIVWSCSCYDENDNFLGKAPAQTSSFIRTFTLLTGTKKVRISVTCSDTTYTILQPMLNTGSTALPYEPYGYKIPISSANTTTPVYLGEAETTRRIKKYEFTGEENWIRESGNTYALEGVEQTATDYDNALCTHYVLATSYNTLTGTDGTFSISRRPALFIHDERFTSVNALKSYLAEQYANGTPVTVWYVLAEPETGIVNEPLMKIGEYADTVSGITIPTITGKDTFDVETTLKPSEVSLGYTGWHDATVKKWDGSQWQ